MMFRNSVSFFLRSLALIALGGAAHATTYVGVFMDHTSINVGGTAAFDIQLRENDGVAFTNGSIVVNYPAGLVNDGQYGDPLQFENCSGYGGIITRTAGVGQLVITNVSLPAFQFCDVYVRVTSSTFGSYTITVPPGSFSSSTPPVTNAVTTSVTLNVVGPTVVTNTADSGAGSLRNAINTVNANCGLVSGVQFNIAGTGPFTISPSSELPALTCGGTFVDGWSQPGSAVNINPSGANTAAIMIDLNGSACAPAPCNGLTLLGGGNQVDGMAIHSFSGNGILSAPTGGTNYVYGTFIGTDTSGMVQAGNGAAGIAVNNGYAQIGNGSAAGRNLVTANAVGGIIAATGAATIDTNQIGGLADGSVGVGNGFRGIYLNGANYSPNTIANNVVITNGGAGIAVTPTTFTRVVIAGNESYFNTGPGIDMNDDGATLNDEAATPYDTDSVQNYPVVTSVSQSGGNTTVSGYMKSVANRSATVFLYANTYYNSITEGEVQIATFSLPLDPTGFNTFTTTVAGSWNNVTAQATLDTCGDGCVRSSEYSPKVVATLPPPAVSLSVSTIDFGALLTGTTSSPFTLVLTNTGGSTLNISSIATSVPFSIASQTCGATLAPDTSCNYDLTFNPLTAGSFGAPFTITSDAPTVTDSVSLVGAGMGPPSFALIMASTSLIVGQATNIGIHVSNPSANPLAYANFNASLTYPAGFVNDNPNGSFPVGGCGDPSFTGGVPGGTSIGSGGAGSAAPGIACAVAAAQIVAPTTPGIYTFTIPAGGFTISSPFVYTNPAPITVTATVSLAPAPGVSFSAPLLTFSPQTVFTTSAPQTLTLTNTGNAVLNIANIFTSGDFAQTNTCPVFPAALAVGANCVISVTFTPDVAGPISGSLIMNSDAAGSPHTIPLSGTGIALAPIVSLTPPSLAFPSRTVSTTSASQTVTLANTGNGALTISSITATGDFAFTSTCAGTVAALASCTINVTFTPLVAGPRTGSVVIVDNAAGSPHAIALTGTGVSGAAGVATVSPGSLDFPAQQTGSSSTPQIVTVTNTGTAPLAVTNVSVTGEFAIGTPAGTGPPPCPASLVPGAACRIAVIFRPTGPNLRQGILTIVAGGGAITLTVVGTGLLPEPPQLTMPFNLDFGPQPVGVTSTGRALAMHNQSTTIASVSELTASGDFDVSDTCTTIAAGATCSPLVTFKPTAIGPRSGTLVVRTLRDANPYSVSLTGTGIENLLPALEVSAEFIGFGNAFIGEPVVKEITLKNSGRATLVVSGIEYSGDYFGDAPCIGPIQPGNTCTMHVTFNAGIPGGRSGVMSIISNAPDSPHNVGLSGTGCFLPTPSRTRFGSLLCGS